MNGFPSIFLYRNGVQLKEYMGQKNIDELKDFIESHKSVKKLHEWEEREKVRQLVYEAKKQEKERRKAEEAAASATA